MKTRNNPNVLQWLSEQTGTSILGECTAQQWKHKLLNKRTWNYTNSWKKPISKAYILYTFIYIDFFFWWGGGCALVQWLTSCLGHLCPLSECLGWSPGCTLNPSFLLMYERMFEWICILFIHLCLDLACCWL